MLTISCTGLLFRLWAEAEAEKRAEAEAERRVLVVRVRPREARRTSLACLCSALRSSAARCVTACCSRPTSCRMAPEKAVKRR